MNLNVQEKRHDDAVLRAERDLDKARRAVVLATSRVETAAQQLALALERRERFLERLYGEKP